MLLAPSARHDEVTMLILAADIGGTRARLLPRHGRVSPERRRSGAGLLGPAQIAACLAGQAG